MDGYWPNTPHKLSSHCGLLSGLVSPGQMGLLCGKVVQVHLPGIKGRVKEPGAVHGGPIET
jgi:hypothetical protein